MKNNKTTEKNALTDKMKDDDFAGFGEFNGVDGKSVEDKKKKKLELKRTSLALNEADLMNIDIIYESLYNQDKIRRTNTEIMRLALSKLAEELKK